MNIDFKTIKMSVAVNLNEVIISFCIAAVPVVSHPSACKPADTIAEVPVTEQGCTLPSSIAAVIAIAGCPSLYITINHK